MNERLTAVTVTSSVVSVLPTINIVIQIIAGLIAIIVGGIQIYKWLKGRSK